jgi:hypothetical protein
MKSVDHLTLARNHFFGINGERFELFMSWCYYKRTQDPEGILELKELDLPYFKGFTKCNKATLTILCLSKYFPNHPKDVYTLLAKYVWNTKYDQEWWE